MTPPEYTIRQLSTQDITGHLLDQVMWTFAGALGYKRQAGRVIALADTIHRHATRGGFRAFGAFTVRERLVGFTYGYASEPGLWWREQIARPLSPAQRDYWLTDAFELAELHVHPSAQGLHLGSRLHDRVVQRLPNSTALLSVMHRSERARQLYASRGWQILVEDMRFATEQHTPFSVLGLTLTRLTDESGGNPPTR